VVVCAAFVVAIAWETSMAEALEDDKEGQSNDSGKGRQSHFFS